MLRFCLVDIRKLEGCLEETLANYHWMPFFCQEATVIFVVQKDIILESSPWGRSV